MSKRLSVPGSLRAQVLERDNYHCVKCGRGQKYRLQVHHIFPVYKGRVDESFNLITLCIDCHKYAPDDPIEFFKYCSRHLSPELVRSKDVAKFMCLAVLNKLGMLTADEARNQRLMDCLNETVDQSYELLWSVIVEDSIEKLSTLFDKVAPPKQEVLL